METKDNASLDCTRCAAVLVELGDKQGYEQFRRDIIKRFAGTPDPLSAERTVKNCLLLPADQDVLASLGPFVDIAEKSIRRRPAVSMSDSWRSSSVAIIEYRREHWNEAIEWCKRSLNFEDNNNARAAMVHAILAMSFYQARQLEEAQAELDKSRQVIGEKFKKGIDAGNGTQGYWFDWIVDRIFQREAEALIEGQNSLPESLQ